MAVTIPGFDPTTNEVYLGAGQKLTNIHNPENCFGRTCVIHNRIFQHEGLRLFWRSDRGIWEVVCKHSIGHPDKNQYEYWKVTNQIWQVVHGCSPICIIECHQDTILM